MSTKPPTASSAPIPTPPAAPKPAASTTATAPPSAQSLLIEWANQQDNWVRALVSEVITTRQELPDPRIGHFYDLLLKEKELAAGAWATVPPILGGVTGRAAAEVFTLTGLDATENVNALAAGQKINFNPRMTIIFGENASGKTGYVRVLKRAAAVRTAEAVLPNVNAPATSANTPKAKIAYKMGAQETSVNWANEAGLHPFTRMDVFDSSCTLLHLDEDLTYIYTPGELSLFPLVQRGLEKVKAKLEAETKQRTPASNTFVREFERGTRVYTKVESLGAATNIEEVRKAQLSDQEQQQTATLTEEIEALRSDTPEAQAKIAQSEQQFLQANSRTLQPFAEFNLDKYEETRTALVRARREYDRATRDAFAGLEIPGVLQPEWRAFVQSGETLLESTQRQDYPSADNDCLYCGQRLDSAAIELVRKYRDYCNNKFQAALAAAENAVSEISRPLLQSGVASAQEAVQAKLTEQTESAYSTLLRELADVLTQAAAVQRNLQTQDAIRVPGIATTARRIAGGLDDRRQEFLKLGTDLRRRSDERGTALKEREARLRELTARSRLAERLPDLEHFVEEAQWVNKANIVGKRFQNIFKTLTDASKTASERLLNQDFEKRFREECKKLRTPEVKLFFPGRQGQVSRRKSVSPITALAKSFRKGSRR